MCIPQHLYIYTMSCTNPFLHVHTLYTQAHSRVTHTLCMYTRYIHYVRAHAIVQAGHTNRSPTLCMYTRHTYTHAQPTVHPRIPTQHTYTHANILSSVHVPETIGPNTQEPALGLALFPGCCVSLSSPAPLPHTHTKLSRCRI